MACRTISWGMPWGDGPAVSPGPGDRPHPRHPPPGRPGRGDRPGRGAPYAPPECIWRWSIPTWALSAERWRFAWPTSGSWSARITACSGRRPSGRAESQAVDIARSPFRLEPVRPRSMGGTSSAPVTRGGRGRRPGRSGGAARSSRARTAGVPADPAPGRLARGPRAVRGSVRQCGAGCRARRPGVGGAQAGPGRALATPQASGVRVRSRARSPTLRLASCSCTRTRTVGWPSRSAMVTLPAGWALASMTNCGLRPGEWSAGPPAGPFPPRRLDQRACPGPSSAGAPHGTLVTASEQSAGRGARAGLVRAAGAGAPVLCGAPGPAAAAAPGGRSRRGGGGRRGIGHLADARVTLVKWPNDVLLEGARWPGSWSRGGPRRDGPSSGSG